MGDRVYRYNFPAPASEAEAIRRRRQLGTDISNIETQLASRNVRDPKTGQRLEDRDYWTWRQAALTARAAKVEEKRFLDGYLAERQASHPSAGQNKTLVLRCLSALLDGRRHPELAREVEAAIRAAEGVEPAAIVPAEEGG